MKNWADVCGVRGRVEGVESLGSMTRLVLRVPGWLPARPGQFVMLQAEGSSCFLGRALSVCDQSEQIVSLLVAPIGPGTRELCALGRGEALRVLGPLGKGFHIQALTAGRGRPVLVGGGVGIAPLPLLVHAMASSRESESPRLGQGPSGVLVLAGFRDSFQAGGDLVLTEAVASAHEAGLACEYERVVEDGSQGSAGLVTDLLARHLRAGDRVAVCGPGAMAKAVWQVCCKVPDVRAWFSLETNMACGVGSCHGCVVELADGSYARVCREGPVFGGEEVYGG